MPGRRTPRPGLGRRLATRPPSLRPPSARSGPCRTTLGRLPTRLATTYRVGGRMKTLVVVPTYQEADNVPDLLRRIRAAAPDADVLVVDDDSPDGTAKIARAVADELGGHIEVLVRPAKTGLGSAYRCG